MTIENFLSWFLTHIKNTEEGRQLLIKFQAAQDPMTVLPWNIFHGNPINIILNLIDRVKAGEFDEFYNKIKDINVQLSKNLELSDDPT